MERSRDVAKTIAVFDDDTDFLDLMRDTLAESGYRVVAEPTANAALAIVLRERPSLVILDFWMAGQGAGLTALRLLRENPETATLPVLICSADHTALNDYADDWRALGCETIEKPFALNGLLQRVGRLIGGESQPSTPTPRG
jgi:DNA-binding response OmpR family regulator